MSKEKEKLLKDIVRCSKDIKNLIGANERFRALFLSEWLLLLLKKYKKL